MPTTLELLLAEKLAQEEEEARPPISSIETARSWIEDTAPTPSENVTLEMCVLRIEEFDKNYRLELIDRELEQQCDTMLETMKTLDVARRSKFIFQLTIWKHRKTELNHLAFRSGFSYRFEKVHSLRLLYGNPVGSMQIRERIRADPLPLLGVNESTTGRDSLLSGANQPRAISSSDDSPATPPQNEREPGGDEPQQSQTEVPASATPVEKKATKRATTKDDDNTHTSKRSRKDVVRRCVSSHLAKRRVQRTHRDCALVKGNPSRSIL